MTITASDIVTFDHLAAWQACKGETRIVRELYPQGVSLTRESGRRLQTAGVDVVFGLMAWHIQYHGSGSNMALTRDFLIGIVERAIAALRGQPELVAALVKVEDKLVDVDYPGAIRACEFAEAIAHDLRERLDDDEPCPTPGTASWREMRAAGLCQAIRLVLRTHTDTESVGGLRPATLSLALRIAHNTVGRELQDVNGVPYWQRGYYREIRDALYNAIGVA